MLRLAFLLPFLIRACHGDETISGYADPGAVYRLGALDGEAFSARATLSFPRQGEVAGEGPCNTFTAAQSVPYPWIEISAMATTRRACADLAAETAYFTALQAMTLAEVSGAVLILSNDAGREMVFQARD